MRQHKASAAGLIGDYVEVLSSVMRSAIATDANGKEVALDFAVEWAVGAARRVTEAGGKIIFAGNGGSAGIASHMATDYSKNGGLRAWAMNDGSMLTCLANDYGYEHVFAKQIEFHGRQGDMLVAISSSGRSPNILGAVTAARRLGCTVLTLSGFKPDNPLRRTGDMNVFLDSGAYGYVEIGHLALCHAILDYSMEWAKDGRAVANA
ncbi:SIS domain-containing protein [Reyranella sp.]|uniref:SIS domain-containing protein n=1 Tax=Reyranella sp. TaxID=1929291 RepID=UPI003BAAA9B2